VTEGQGEIVNWGSCKGEMGRHKRGNAVPTKQNHLEMGCRRAGIKRENQYDSASTCFPNPDAF